ncbi:MAG: aminodeoxychorismate lyase [Sulfurimonas sp. RIFOXYD12_FULL_33_39]|uniref:endolytic transglycosylase MltG n=2 Tax=unclassified Sulfurimonas TaxID=2623549 RepID=UPI0008BDD135|nr:endolytic transglycosylase MltG [Sulfurimonas sp. RIFOXYD2_FULL_34_21]OHE04139.1 MAG: aminodeoxychorismate lyase [Sulfurimonas sp. RIFCSPLOWO2_12_FULL_34_6]OHE09354.1 MAG: aminodeoxychorismate lyase [Sulfurimonas sp. RIFOXYD12_FULL_33_39]OHE12863.1 MAG: aminodeoxychorismate lyase [Sulfurimonas sp. RIFOXYD2_FULL_34_21]
MNDKALTIIKWIFEIVLIIILSFMYYLNKPVSSPKVIYIPKGSINKIITQMQSRNYNVSKLDILLLRLFGSPQSGWINIETTLNSRWDFLYKLTTAKAALQNITLIPGETTYIFLNQLADELKLNRDLLQKEYEQQSPYEEGAFTPNTYSLPIGITEKIVIKILLNESLAQMKNLSIKLFGMYNEKKWLQYVTIASIIQKESASIEEMPLVSSVIYNRIKKGMKLQMDGTLNYGKNSHVKVTPSMIKEDTSTYNTYLYSGIPPLPVCNVSFDAIKAAIFPAKSDYLYFMKSKDAKHDFTSNYSTHLSNIKRATK